MIRKAKAIHAADFKQHNGDPVSREAPRYMDIHGQRTLLIHASDLTTGVMGPSEAQCHAGDASMFIMIATPGEIGLYFKLETEHAKTIIASLQKIVGKVEAAAAAAADAALKKAAGK